MQPFPLASANASVISVTTTATALLTLINTAGATTHDYRPHLNAVDLVVEDGDVRILLDTNTPTASKGLLLKRGATYRLRFYPLSQIKLISATGSAVSCSVQVGHSEPGESTSVTQLPGYLLEKLDRVNDEVTTYPKGATVVNLTASGQILAGPGKLLAVTIVSHTATATVRLANNTAVGSGYIDSGRITEAAHKPGDELYRGPLYLSVGGYITITGTVEVNALVIAD